MTKFACMKEEELRGLVKKLAEEAEFFETHNITYNLLSDGTSTMTCGCRSNILDVLYFFKQYLTEYKDSESKLRTYIKESTLWSLSRAFLCADEKVWRECGIVIARLLQYKSFRQDIYKIVTNLLLERVERCGDGVRYLFSLAVALLKYETLMCRTDIFYHQFILPHISWDVPGVAFLFCVSSFCRKSSRCAVMTLQKVLLNSKNATVSDSQRLLSVFLEVMVVISSWERACHFDEAINKAVILTAEIFSAFLQSENYAVIEELFFVFQKESIQSFFRLHNTIILPKIFPVLYKQSKTFWKTEQRCQFLVIIKHMMEWNEELFEDCLIEYNMQKTLRK